MSGPIIRKYGFPNFEKIFGERELKHGAEPDATKGAADSEQTADAKPEIKPVPPGAEAPKNPAS